MNKAEMETLLNALTARVNALEDGHPVTEVANMKVVVDNLQRSLVDHAVGVQNVYDEFKKLKEGK